MITLKVTPDNGDAYEVTATSRDVLTWEKTTGSKKSFVDLVESPNLIDLYTVAWLASWRQKLTTAKNYKEFEETCEVTGLDKDEEPNDEPDPTQPVPSIEPSSPSLSEPASAPVRGRKKANARS